MEKVTIKYKYTTLEHSAYLIKQKTFNKKNQNMSLFYFIRQRKFKDNSNQIGLPTEQNFI